MGSEQRDDTGERSERAKIVNSQPLTPFPSSSLLAARLADPSQPLGLSVQSSTSRMLWLLLRLVPEHFDIETSRTHAGEDKTKRSSSREDFSLFKNERSSAKEARTRTRGPCFRDGFLLAKANTTAANTRSRRKQPKRSTSSGSSLPVVSTSTSTSAGPASPHTLSKGQLCLYGCRASAEDDLFFKGSGGTEFVRIVGEWP